MNAPDVGFSAGTELAEVLRSFAGPATRSILTGQLTLHQVDAPVLLHQLEPLDGVSLAALRAIPGGGDATLESLAHRFGVGRALVRQLMNSLAVKHLIEEAAVNAWRRSPVGEEALRSKRLHREVYARREFHFVHHNGTQRPHFLRLHHPTVQSFEPPADWRFHPDSLRGHLLESDEWKRRHNFPLEYKAPAELGLKPEQRVIVDRAVRIQVILVESDGWQGFAVHGNLSEPLFRLSAEAARETFGAILDPPSEQDWRTAVQILGESAVALERAGAHLRVRFGKEEFRLDEEKWMFAGTGPIRWAARVIVVAS